MNRRDFLVTGLAAAVTAASPVLAGQARAAQGMHILVLTGSPRLDGNTCTLAANFARGAEEAGHTVYHFDCAHKQVHPCTACNSCGMDGPCVFDDDFEEVREHLAKAQMVVFATPLYYYGITAQLKRVIDRFYAVNAEAHRPRKAALFATYANSSVRRADPLRTHYRVLMDYLNWTSVGEIVVPGIWPVGAINSTIYPQKAYELGKSLQA